jgi:hypothetical protein
LQLPPDPGSSDAAQLLPADSRKDAPVTLVFDRLALEIIGLNRRMHPEIMESRPITPLVRPVLQQLQLD